MTTTISLADQYSILAKQLETFADSLQPALDETHAAFRTELAKGAESLIKTAPTTRMHFAFGSNMDMGQMAVRCPTARLLGSVVLPDHRIVFAGWSYGWGGAVATYEPRRRSSLPGVLWSLTASDVFALDRAEGVPTVYDRAFVKVLDEDAREHDALTYRMVRGSRSGRPSFEYVSQIAEAYERERFSTTQLMKAARR